MQLAMCISIIMANCYSYFVDLTDHLRLNERLKCYECEKLIKFIAECDLPWKCKHINYLVVKSAMPGSGVAASLACNLSVTSWKNLLRKEDLDMETLQAIVSLKGVISAQDVVSIAPDKDMALLQFAIKNSTPKFNDSCLTKLAEEAIKLKKSSFAQVILDYLSPEGDSDKLIQQALKYKDIIFIEKFVSCRDAEINPASIVNILSKSDLTNKGLISYVMSTPEGQKSLFLKAVELFEFKLAEQCLKGVNDNAKKIDLSNILKFLNQGNKDSRQELYSFTKRLLKLKCDPNGLEGGVCPLDVILGLSKEFQSEKTCFLVLLLQHGATIAQCTYQRKNGTTLIHVATQFAIETGETIGNMSIMVTIIRSH